MRGFDYKTIVFKTVKITCNCDNYVKNERMNYVFKQKLELLIIFVHCYILNEIILKALIA